MIQLVLLIMNKNMTYTSFMVSFVFIKLMTVAFKFVIHKAEIDDSS